MNNVLSASSHPTPPPPKKVNNSISTCKKYWKLKQSDKMWRLIYLTPVSMQVDPGNSVFFLNLRPKRKSREESVRRPFYSSSQLLHQTEAALFFPSSLVKNIPGRNKNNGDTKRSKLRVNFFISLLLSISIWNCTSPSQVGFLDPVSLTRDQIHEQERNTRKQCCAT